MNLLAEALVAIRDFFEAGGNVLWAILAVTALMWTLIIERLWYLYRIFPAHLARLVQQWNARASTTSWHARMIRQMMVSQASIDVRRYLLMIKALMAVLPLLGLLGTVTGMVQVFDVMAMTGTGNARLMAAGVSAATIPTMSGLVAALSGLYLAKQLENKARTEITRVQDLLVRS
jgi:biopolymer transport protein ExbB